MEFTVAAPGSREHAFEDAGSYGPVGRSKWLDVDWHEHQRWVEVQGRAVNTISIGSGPAVLFVHGLSGCWANWLEQLPVFAAGHTAIALDLPGFGHSPMPRDPISMPGYAAILDELMQSLGIPDAALVGNSMGGEIAAELAISFPARVSRLVLVSAAGISTHRDPATMRLLPAIWRMERALQASGSYVGARSERYARRARLRRSGLNVVMRHPEQIPAPLAAEQIGGAGKQGFVPALAGVMEHELRSRLGAVACPTLVVWGERDRLVPVRDADVFAQSIPRARKVVYADTGHMPMLERPAAFNTLLEDFLAR